MVVTGPVGKHFGNLESYPVHNQINRVVLIESKSLVFNIIGADRYKNVLGLPALGSKGLQIFV